MKATGIVRRIDDLGRIVVPKEIRRILRIREGDNMEIFTDAEGGIVLKKYSPIGEMGNVASQYADSLAQVSGQIAIITDRDQVIAATGAAKREYTGRRISKKLENILIERDLYHSANGKPVISITDNDSTTTAEQLIQPIICEGDVIGSVIIMSKDKEKGLSEIEKKLVNMASNFLGRRMEA